MSDDIANLIASMLTGCEVNITITLKKTDGDEKQPPKRKLDENVAKRRAPKKIIRREPSNNVDTVSEINIEEYVAPSEPDKRC